MKKVTVDCRKGGVVHSVADKLVSDSCNIKSMAGLVECFDVGSLQDVRMMRMTLTCSSEWGLQEAVNWLLMVAAAELEYTKLLKLTLAREHPAALLPTQDQFDRFSQPAFKLELVT